MGKRRIMRDDHAVYKNNFWNQLRKERGITFKQIGDILGRSSTMIRYYFMGKQMPPQEHINMMCEGFNVDVEQGTAEFKKMHKEWKETHDKSTTKPKTVTFWGQKLKEAKISYKELSEIISVPYSTLKAYFSGFALPNSNTLANICNLLDVDLTTGESEFLKLHTAWGESHPDYEKYGNTYRRITSATGNNHKPVESSPSDYLEILYGKLSCADFRRIDSMTFADGRELLRTLYDMIDFDTFMLVMESSNV